MGELHTKEYREWLLHSIYLFLVHNYAWVPLGPCSMDSQQFQKTFHLAKSTHQMFNPTSRRVTFIISKSSSAWSFSLQYINHTLTKKHTGMREKKFINNLSFGFYNIELNLVSNNFTICSLFLSFREIWRIAPWLNKGWFSTCSWPYRIYGNPGF